MKRLGERIGQIRTTARRSQRDVARHMKVGWSTVARWETGESRIYAHHLPALADMLGVQPCDFFREPLPAEKRSSGDIVDRGTDYLARELALEALAAMSDEEIGQMVKRRLSEGENRDE